MIRSLAALVFSILPYPLALGGLAAILSDVFKWELALGIGGSSIDVPQDRYVGVFLLILAVVVFLGDRYASRLGAVVAKHRTTLLVGGALVVVGLVIGGSRLIVALDGGPAITAAMNGEADALAGMFERGEVDAADHEPMMLWAAQKGHAETIRVLLAHGVSPDAKRHDGLPALKAACMWGGAEAVGALQAGGARGRCEQGVFAAAP